MLRASYRRLLPVGRGAENSCVRLELAERGAEDGDGAVVKEVSVFGTPLLCSSPLRVITTVAKQD